MAAAGLAACRGEAAGPVPGDALRLVQVASGLSLPLYLAAPTGDHRLFVVEQPGRIRIIEAGVLLPRAFLDITSKVSSGGERGLLSVAFHPQYATNRHLYVDYTDLAGDTRIERYTVSPADPDIVDLSTVQPILYIPQPYANHNGGLLVFGPDGMLYVGTGDGGSGGDPHGYGQSTATLLGKLLRIDVDVPEGAAYAIPLDNPFVDVEGARGEIWAVGLRNPWRFAFDRVADHLYVADVGQNRREEVHVVAAGRPGVNYGWNILEGSECFGGSTDCDAVGLERPVLEYTHAEGCSIAGGFVYRGARIPAVTGHYFYSDFCAGFVRSFRYAGGAAVDRRTWDVGDVGPVLSFGRDAAGELYVLSAKGGVYRLDAR